MLHKIKFFTILFVYISICSSVFAENKIAYLDLDFILLNTNIGKITLEKLEMIEKKKNNELKNQEKKLKE